MPVLLKFKHCLVFILPGSKMCILYTHHGGVLGHRGCGAGCYCPPSVGSVSVIWCPWIQTSLYSLLQGRKRALHGRLDCCGRRGTVEFTQTNCSSSSVDGWSSASKVRIYMGEGLCLCRGVCVCVCVCVGGGGGGGVRVEWASNNLTLILNKLVSLYSLMGNRLQDSRESARKERQRGRCVNCSSHHVPTGACLQAI